jgi:hypothetical protein
LIKEIPPNPPPITMIRGMFVLGIFILFIIKLLIQVWSLSGLC